MLHEVTLPVDPAVKPLLSLHTGEMPLVRSLLDITVIRGFQGIKEAEEVTRYLGV